MLSFIVASFKPPALVRNLYIFTGYIYLLNTFRFPLNSKIASEMLAMASSQVAMKEGFLMILI